MPPPRQSAPLSNTSYHLMILRIRRLFIQNLKRFSIQLGKLALEPNPIHPRHVLLASAMIILDEQGEAVRVAKERSADGEVLDFVCARDCEGLGWSAVDGGGKVEVVGVAKEFECGWAGGGVGGAEEDGVEFYYAGESGWMVFVSQEEERGAMAGAVGGLGRWRGIDVHPSG